MTNRGRFFEKSAFFLLGVVLLNGSSLHIECLRPYGGNLNVPSPEADKHFADLLIKTRSFRSVEVHKHAGYSGPWIENLFIKRFLYEPLSMFKGMIPLFIQWTDIMVLAMRGSPDIQLRLFSVLPSLLRPDILYVTVSQHDYGLGANLTRNHPNILILSAGGYGHVPLPLVKGELKYIEAPQNPDNFTYDFSFFGKITHESRAAIFIEFQRALDFFDANYKFCSQDDHWSKKMAQTKFNLAPRGLGRASFRLSEVVQLGRIPIFLYDDEAWLPYGSSNLSVLSIGYIGKLGHLHHLVARLVNASVSEIMNKLRFVREARYAYTYEGILEQIALFFADPFGPKGGALRCVPLPQRVN
jgi:hypothetical protein